MAASPSLLERNNHPAVTLDPDSLKLRISLSSSYRKEFTAPTTEEEEDFTEEVDDGDEDGKSEDIPWDESLYESLRLCRKRAYCKVQSKRRLHLHACLSVYLHREWNALYPQHKIKPRDLLDIYETRFEGGSKRRRPYVKKTTKKVLPRQKVLGVQWTPSTLMHLTLIGQKVEKLLDENPQLDYSSKLQEEWLKYYPDSTLTGRNLKARLFLYNKTRPDYVYHAKKSDVWNKEALELLVKVYNQLTLEQKSSTKLHESLLRQWEKGYQGPLSLTASDLVFKIEELLEKEPDLFLSTENTGNRPAEEEDEPPSQEESSFVDESPSWSYRIPLPPKGEWACGQHWVHIFEEGSPSLDCSLTEDLVNIRNSYKDLYPNCDIFEKPYLKQPRKAGLIGAIVNEWGRRHPDYEDSVRSIVLKLYKYDRIPEVSYFTSLDNRAKLKYYLNGGGETAKAGDEIIHSNHEDFEWTEEMLDHLKEAREFAEMKAEENANGTPSVQAVTRIWKNRWKSKYPDLTLDWKTAVEKYNSLGFGSISMDDISSVLRVHAPKRHPADSDMTPSEDSEVKGFRQWNVAMKQGLINTKDKIIRSLHPQSIDLESKQFASLLFNEFRKLFPKCMESTRSLLSKLQSIEKEGFVPHDYFKEEEEQKLPDVIGNGVSCAELSVMRFSDDMDVVMSKADDFKDEIMPPITGFPRWNLSMIRDFIACMDVARKKYASLKVECSSDKQPRLIPLLLNEWKEIYPGSIETDKTFLEKIKHLKVQKETIKAYLGQSGLLPRREEAEKLPVVEDAEEKVGWNKSMMEDVIRTRDIALKRLGETQTKGKKMSFHHTWWEEFKKIHPNCSFGKNNLSAHYWKWKKSQNVLEKKSHHQKLPSEQQNNRQQPPTEPKYQSKRSYTNWTKEDKDQLLDLAFKLQKSSTENEALRTKGFGSVLRDQWKQLRPDRVDHPSTLNLLYAKYLKEIKMSSTASSSPAQERDGGGRLKVSNWTPKHNQVLRKCLTDCPIANDGEGFAQWIIDAWKKSFPSSTLSDGEIQERLNDFLTVKSSSWNLTPEAKKYLNLIFARIFCQTLNRRRMRKDVIILPEQKLELAVNLHRAFLNKFPDCPLSPYSLLNESDIFRSKYSEEEESEYTWTPLMITNMIETRKAALQEKKLLGEEETPFNFGDVWYAKFLTCHPEYTSTKRSLIRKYKWYKSHLDSNGLIHSDEASSSSIPTDLLTHINALLETSQVSLPIRPPPKEELFKSSVGEPPSQLIATDKPFSSSSSAEGRSFHFPGGARLIPISSVEAEEESTMMVTSSDDSDISVLDIPSAVESRLQNLDLSAKDFHDLLNVYAIAREEYASALKQGYLAFFPFTLQLAWSKKGGNAKEVSGRSLADLVEMFLEKWYANSPAIPPSMESIERDPNNLRVSELNLRQVLSCFSEAGTSSQREYSKDASAYELWKIHYPKLSFTFKELVSLHRMLLFEANCDTDMLDNLTLDCTIADISYQFAKSSRNLCESLESVSEYDDGNVSIEQLKDWYFKTKCIPSSMGIPSPPSFSPHFGVKNLRLFWSHDRMSDLQLCYQKAEYSFRRQGSNNPRYRRYRYKKSSFLVLMGREWRKMHPYRALDGKILVGKYVSHLRRRMSERSHSENLRIHEWNLDVLDFLDAEHTSTHEPETYPEEPEDEVLENDDEEEPESPEEVTVEEVLQKIDEKGKRSAVWTSSVMRDLLIARDESKRRKKEIERDPKLQKVDNNLFVEEWKKIRPKMGHMSIWTLNAYVRKFDQFRNKLIQSKKVTRAGFSPPETTKRRVVPIKYFPGSCIPIYDLEVIETLKGVSQEVKDLLVTRQRAMEAKAGSKYTLDYLWPLEWKKVNPALEMTANQLRNKLWSVERFPSNMERLRVALLRSSPSESRRNAQGGGSSYIPILPRRYLFPEEQVLRTPFRFTQKVSFNHHPCKDAFLSIASESLSCREASLDIPKVKFDKQVLHPEADKFLPKRIKLETPAAKPLAAAFSYDSSGSFVCSECGKKFRNINNFDFHAQMH